MYQLIIVDDEKAIRKGIRDYIDWNSMGFEVVATFEDGKEALEYMSRHSVDVVLTDIEMAEISGLELSRQIREQKCSTKVVIISGYKEFEYARKAVEYGVEHYLLKPIKMDEVKDVFIKIADSLDIIYSQKDEMLTNQNNFSELLPELREQFWISLLVGGIRSKENIIKRMEWLNIDLDKENPFLIADIQLEIEEGVQTNYGGESFHNLINNLCGGEMDDILSFPVCLSEEIIKVIMTTKRKESLTDFENRAKKQLKERSETADSLLNIKFSSIIEKSFHNIMEITEYQWSIALRNDKPDEEYNEISEQDYNRLMQKYRLLMGIINDGDFEALDSLLDNIFYEFRTMQIVQVQKICIDMFSMLSGKLMKMGIDMWKVWNQKFRYKEFMEIHELSLLKEKTKEQLQDIICIVKEKQNVSSRYFVNEAIKYMKNNFSEELSLEMIAGKFFLNQTYFSRLFKQYTGSTFTDYLIELRMERAKEYLSQGKYKVYEVSQMVGYRSEKYFFRIFKQYTGCSPTEYFRGKKTDE